MSKLILNDEFNPSEAMRAIKTGDINAFERQVAVCPDPTKLLADVIIKGNADRQLAMVRYLLEHKASPCQLVDGNCSALHLAIERGMFDTVQTILQYNADPMVLTSNMNTGLHCAVLGLNQGLYQGEDIALKCIQQLLSQNEAILNLKNYGGFSTVFLSVKFKFWKIVEFLINKGANIDSKINKTTARQLIMSSSNVDIKNIAKEIPEKIELNADMFTTLYQFLEAQTEEEFLQLAKTDNAIFKSVINKSHEKNTLLQLAARNGNLEATQLLINAGADVNLSTASNSRSPPMIAIYSNHGKVLELLLDTNNCNFQDNLNEIHKQTVLHIAVLYQNNPEIVRLLLENAEKCKLDINAQDFRQYTALHYAGKQNKFEIVNLLLKHNAKLFLTDYENIPAFFNISVKSMKSYLDSCVETEKTITDDDYKLVLDFQFLSMDTTNNFPATCNIQLGPHTSLNMPEMFPLEMIANSPEHKVLLVHPVIRSFLHLKWYRICWYLCINFFFYFLFTTSLSLHVYQIITSNITDIDGTEQLTGEKFTFLGITTLILLIIFAIRESIQLIMAPVRYINQIENWLEILIITLTAILLIYPSKEREFLQTISSFLILLTFTEFVLLAGRHPILATYIKMFFKVLTSFLQLLLWYSLLIFGFGFAFYIVFRHGDKRQFFYEFVTSIFKTTIMITGEFDSGELEFDSVSITSHIIFILFLFFIAIVLLNLLTGLAVSDTQMIRSQAELHCCVAQVRLYSQLESVLIGGTHCNGNPIRNWIADNILLIPKLREYGKQNLKLRVLLKKENVLLPDIRGYSSSCSKFSSTNCLLKCTCLRKSCQWCYIFSTIVTDARAIAEEKETKSDNDMLMESLELLMGVPGMLRGLETSITELSHKLSTR